MAGGQEGCTTAEELRAGRLLSVCVLDLLTRATALTSVPTRLRTQPLRNSSRPWWTASRTSG
jgi:hypothetical protein